jgi:hypothetical protein
MKRFDLVRAIGLVAAAVLSPTLALAQSMGLSPAEIRASFTPQQVLQFDLSVSNEGDMPVPMRGSVNDLWFDPSTNEKVFGAPGTLPRSASNWVTFVPATFTVPPHGTATVKVMVTPPPGATGGSYAVLFVESKPALSRDPSGSGRAVYANLRLGALLLLTAKGTADYRVDVRDALLTRPGANQNLAVTFRLRNAGNAHIFPNARVTVTNAEKRVVARAAAEIRRLFPGQDDSVSVTWAGLLPPGAYTAVLTIGYGDDKVYTQALPFLIEGTAPSSGE